MLKNRKGLSLTTMVITVMIMFVIMGTMVYSAVDSVKIRKLNKLYNDLRQLSDAVEVYCLKNGGELPVYSDTDKTITLAKTENAEEKKIGFVLKKGSTAETGNFFNPNDFHNDKAEYKYLNLSLLDNISLNYNEENGYIINTRSHTIYYMTGLSVGGKTYNYLPLTYVDTNYEIAPAAYSMKLKPVAGLTNGANTIYFSPSNDQINLKELIEFNSEEENVQGKPETINFSLSENSKYYNLDEESGILTKKSGASEVSDITSDYTTEVTVSAKNYESEEKLSRTFTIATSSIDICSTNSTNLGPIEEINLVSNSENESLVYKKVSTENKEIKIEKNGFLRTQNSLDMVPTAENSEIASATYNNDNKTKYVVVNSGNVAGSTELTLEVQDYGLAKDTVTVNVFDFELNNEADKEKENITKLDFSGLGEKQEVNLKLNYNGPKDFRFDGDRNKLEWSIVNDKGEVDNSKVVNLTSKDNFDTVINLIPKKIGKTNLKCKITVGREVIAEMMVPITVSGLERADGKEIQEDTIKFSKNGEKSVELKYNFGKDFEVTPVIETPTVIPTTEFKVTRLENDKFKVEYIGNSDVTAVLEIVIKVGEEELKDSLNIVVSK